MLRSHGVELQECWSGADLNQNDLIRLKKIVKEAERKADGGKGEGGQSRETRRSRRRAGSRGRQNDKRKAQETAGGTARRQQKDQRPDGGQREKEIQTRPSNNGAAFFLHPSQ